MNTAKSKPTAKKPPERQIVITRVFDAPREVVFKAWTDPEEMARWWGPKGFTNPVCEMDVRPGGLLRIVMRGPQGNEHPMTGEFREVAPPGRLVFTTVAEDADGNPLLKGVAEATFEDQGGKTKLTLRASAVGIAPIAAQMLEGMNAGWSQSIERLADLLAASDREIVITRVVDAPPGMVWEAMTNPEHVVNWWGPRGFTTTIETMDVRPGGVWKHVMHGPDGTDYPNRSVFEEVVKPERIVYSHGGGRKGGPAVRFKATWTFEAEGGGTRVTIRQVFPSAEMRDRVAHEYGAIEGGRQCLERLAEFVTRA